MRRPHLVRLLAAPAAALLLLSGCGGADDDAGAEETSQEGSEGAEEAEQQVVGPEGELTQQDFGERVAAAFEEAGTVGFELTQATAGQTVEGTGEGDLTGDEVRSRVVLETPQGPVEAIAVDGLFYLKIAQLTDDRFLEVDPDDEEGFGALVGQLGGNADPTAQIEVLGEASEVTAQGEEEIGGVPTTRYRLVLPGAAIAESLQADPQVADLLPEQVEYLVWVDADDLIRQLSSEISVQGTTSTTEVRYTSYGEPVDIEAPPASQVTTDLPGMGG